MIITAGSIDISVYYYIVQDASGASPGEPVTGLLFSDIETGGSASYARQGAARADLTLITLASASAAHADGGFILVDDTNMPGLYRCDYPDAAFTTGVDQVMLQIVVASGKNAVASPIFVDITDVDLRDSVRGGMTALPNAAADAPGGLPISDAGGLDLDSRLDADVSSRLAPTVAARTLDVTATGAAGIDWGNIENKTTVNDLSSTDIQLVDTATAVTNDVGITQVGADKTWGTTTRALTDKSGFGVNSLAANTITAASIAAAAFDGKGDWNIGKTNYSISGTITTLDGLENIAATDIVTAGAIGTLSGAVVNVDLVDNCTANADMRGTNSALLAADINLTGGAVDTVTTVTNDVGITAQAVDDIIDEVLTGGTHNVPDSLGRRIRDLQEFGVYESGAVWIDTVNGTPGTTDFESGTAFNPVNTMADANTLAASLGLSRFRIASGSTIPLAASQNNQAFIGENWTLTLGGQDVGGTLFAGAAVSGIGTGTSQIKFISCALNGATLNPFEARRCSLGGDMILQGTTPTDSDYFFHQCFSEIAGTATPSIDFGAVETDTNVNMRDYSGGIEIKNMGQAGVDNMSLEGDGQLIINANCSGGTIAIRGNFTVTDNAGGAVTLVDDARYDTTQINTEVGVALNTTVLTESYAADGAEFTAAQGLYEINQSLNEFAIVSTTYTVKERDGATTALTYTLDSATVPTSKTRTA